MRACFAVFLLPGVVAAQSGHSNMETDHPLSFDDAYSMGLNERSISFSSGFGTRPGFDLGLALGFAMNQDLSIGYGTREREVEVSYFHGIRREMERAPGMGYRVTARVPRHGAASLGLRGVMTTTVNQYGKLHMNLDFELAREIGVGALLGYSTPIGLPRHFDTVFVAELGAMVSQRARPQALLGVGLRHQTSPTGILDFGIERRAGHTQVKVGYVMSF